MKYLIVIFFSSFFIQAFSQNLNKAYISDFTINGFPLMFSAEKLKSFEKKIGKLSNDTIGKYEEFPFIRKIADEKLENKEIVLYIKNHNVCVSFIDMEKTKSILKYKGKEGISNKMSIKDFSKMFPLSYNAFSTIPGVPIEKAVGYSIIIYRNRKKAYLNFSFYDNHLVYLSISNNYTKITN